MPAQHAEAAEPKVITLSCNGTLTETMFGQEQPPEQMDNVGVVVNLDERTVSFLGSVVHIHNVDAAYMNFSETEHDELFDVFTMGEIDRVTGYFEATRNTLMKSSTKESGYSSEETAHYKMLCKATSRVF
jgi:hypothetical protein